MPLALRDMFKTDSPPAFINGLGSSKPEVTPLHSQVMVMVPPGAPSSYRPTAPTPVRSRRPINPVNTHPTIPVSQLTELSNRSMIYICVNGCLALLSKQRIMSATHISASEADQTWYWAALCYWLAHTRQTIPREPPWANLAYAEAQEVMHWFLATMAPDSLRVGDSLVEFHTFDVHLANKLGCARPPAAIIQRTTQLFIDYDYAANIARDHLLMLEHEKMQAASTASEPSAAERMQAAISARIAGATGGQRHAWMHIGTASASTADIGAPPVGPRVSSMPTSTSSAAPSRTPAEGATLHLCPPFLALKTLTVIEYQYKNLLEPKTRAEVFYRLSCELSKKASISTLSILARLIANQLTTTRTVSTKNIPAIPTSENGQTLASWQAARVAAEAAAVPTVS